MIGDALPSTRRGPREVALEDVQAAAVTAQRARVQQSAIGNLDADTAEVRGSVVEQAHSAHLETTACVVQRSTANVSEIDRSLVGVAQSGDVSMQMAASVVAVCETMAVQNGAVGVAAVRGPAEVKGLAGVIVAPSVALHGRALLVLSPRVDGEYSVVLGLRQALLAGLAGGLVLFVLQRLFRR